MIDPATQRPSKPSILHWRLSDFISPCVVGLFSHALALLVLAGCAVLLWFKLEEASKSSFLLWVIRTRDPIIRWWQTFHKRKQFPGSYDPAFGTSWCLNAGLSEPGVKGVGDPPPLHDFGIYSNPILIKGCRLRQRNYYLQPPPHCVLNGVLCGHFLGIKM